VPEEAELGVKWVLGPGMLTDLFEGAPPLRPFDPHHGLILTLDGGVCTASLFHTWAGWEKPACFDPAGRLRWSSSGQFGLATNPVLITAPDGRLYWTAGDGVMETAPRQEGLWEERVLLSANLLPFRPAVADLQVGPSGTLLAFQEWFPVLLSRCGERIWGIEQVMVPALSTVGSSVLNPTREAGISHEVSAAGEVVATYRAPGRTTVVLPVDEGLLMWWEYEPNGEAGIWVGFSAPGEAMPRSLTRVAWGPYLALPDETVVGWSGDPDETLQVLRPGEEPRTLEFDHPAAEPVLGVGPVLARAEDTGRRDPAGAEDCRSRLAVYDLAGALRSAIDVEGVCRAHSPVLAPDGTAYFVARAYVEDVPGDNMWDHLKPVLVAVQTDVPGHAPGISRWPWRDAYGMGSTVADRLASPLP